MLGKVILNKLNLMQGGFNEVERYLLYVGRGSGSSEGELVTVSGATDLDLVLGASGFNLKTQVSLARSNAGQDFSAAVLPLPEGMKWQEAVDFAMEQVNVEGIVFTDAIASVGDIEDMQQKAEDIMGRYMRPLFMAACARQMESSETFSEYLTAIRPLTKNVLADQCLITPSLWGYEQGTLMGRLCKASVSVADTPMRTMTGTLLGRWTERPKDSSGREIDLSILEALDADRFSVPQWYPGVDGTYWADGNVLDKEGGDYQVIENLRVINKCMRRIYPLAVARVGDRRLNQTAESIARAKTYFLRPLREMSKGFTLMGDYFPGDIVAPDDDDMSITWPTRNEVILGIAAQPYNCPKKISVNLALDLTNYAE